MKTKVLFAAVAVAFSFALSSCGNKKADAGTETSDSCCATKTEQCDSTKACCKSGEATCDSTKTCDKTACDKAACDSTKACDKTACDKK